MRHGVVAVLVLTSACASTGPRLPSGTRTFDAAGTRFELLPHARLRATADDVETWLSAAAEAALPIAGEAAPERIRVTLTARPGTTPVVFGETSYVDGAAMRLVVGSDANGADFRGEWVAVHELAHLALPRCADPWLSEGLATYYQEILRGRADLLTEAECWSRLRDGFDRGRRAGGDAALADESRSMRRRHAYTRVYWSGAAIALLWDVALRRDHNTTLDAALRRAMTEFRPGGRRPPAAEIITRMEPDPDARVLARIAERWLAAKEFPDVVPTLEDLGVLAGGVADDAGGAKLRRAILRR